MTGTPSPRSAARTITSHPWEYAENTLTDWQATRDEMALVYAALLRHAAETAPWKRINEAIIERWSVSALVYIKRQAWRRSEGGARG